MSRRTRYSSYISDYLKREEERAVEGRLKGGTGPARARRIPGECLRRPDSRL